MRKFLSAPYWVHLIIDTIIGQFIWWIISMIMGTAILVRSIIAGAVLIATIFAVAYYLPKLNRDRKTDSITPKKDSLSDNESTKVTNVQTTTAIFSPFSHVHKCSKCGWGFQATIVDNIAKCPKCGNVDDPREH